MASVRRVIAVTAGLSAAGLVVGAAVGAIVGGAFIALTLLTAKGGAWNVGATLAASAMYGGALGMVLGPIAAWLLMRHVPIGRALGETALGTAIGSFLGILLVWFPVLLIPFPPLTLALAGFAAAAVRLRVMHRKKDVVATLPPGD